MLSWNNLIARMFFSVLINTKQSPQAQDPLIFTSTCFAFLASSLTRPVPCLALLGLQAIVRGDTWDSHGEDGGETGGGWSG